MVMLADLLNAGQTTLNEFGLASWEQLYQHKGRQT